MHEVVHFLMPKHWKCLQDSDSSNDDEFGKIIESAVQEAFQDNVRNYLNTKCFITPVQCLSLVLLILDLTFFVNIFGTSLFLYA